MRTWAARLTAAVVLGTPISAAAGGPGTDKIVVLPIDEAHGDGGGEPALNDALLQAIVAGASSEKHTVEPVKTTCRDADCVARVAADNAAAYVLATTVTANMNDYRVEIAAYDATGAVRRSSKFDCQICTHPELAQRVQHETAALRDELGAAAAPVAGEAPVARPARLSVTSTPGGARVFVDGVAVGVTPYEGDIAIGEHILRVEAQNHAEQVVSFDAREGRENAFALALPRADASSRTPGRPLRIAGYTTLSAGVGALVAGAVLLAIDSRPVRGRCTPDRIDVNGECEFVHDTMTVGAVLTAVGVAAVVTGTALVVVGLRRSRNKTEGSNRRAALTLGGLKF